MAGDYNKVILLGRLTRDPEVRYTQSNMAIAKLGVAITRRYRTADGQTKEEPVFIDADAFGKTAEVIGKYLTKGRPIFIEGHLRTDTWQDKDSGQNRSKLKVVVDSFQFVDSRAGGGSGGGGAGGGGGGGGGAGGGEYGQEHDHDAPPQRSGRPGPRSGSGGGGGGPAGGGGGGMGGGAGGGGGGGSEPEFNEEDIPF
ncbi:MAG: single-stranded DNA-binding protein [Planctomyces sp.]|nr:single-stranded DNA-binding protein [Planctomyces sp.]